MATLSDVIADLEQLNDELVIFARKPWDADCEAVAVLDEEAPAGFAYFLEVPLAVEALHVWSAWREGRASQPDEALGAVLHYAENDAYQPGPEEA